MDLLKGAVGEKGSANLIGKAVGDFVEDKVTDILSGNKGGDKKEEKGGGGGGGPDIGDVLSAVTGKKDNNKEEGGGFGNMLGGLIKK